MSSTLQGNPTSDPAGDTARPAELRSLTGLRGAAALMVLAYHAPWLSGSRIKAGWGDQLWQRILDACDAGVALFFILSGFLLSRPYWSKGLSEGGLPNTDQYVLRRAARILPCYWLALFIFQLPHDRTWTGQGLAVFASAFFGLDSWLHRGWEFRNHPVLWTISIELMFYLLLPLCFLFFRMGPGQRSDRITILLLSFLVLFSGPLYLAATRSLAPHLPDFILHQGRESPATTQTVFHFFAWFGSGVLLARLETAIQSRGWIGKMPWNTILIVGLALLTAVLCIAQEGQWRTRTWLSWGSWPSGIIGFLLIVLSAPHSTLGALVFESLLFRWFGTVSYGIYLWHVPVMRAVYQGSLKDHLDAFGLLWAGGVIGVAATMLVAYFGYVFLERPAIRWARKHQTLGGALKSIAHGS